MRRFGFIQWIVDIIESWNIKPSMLQAIMNRYEGYHNQPVENSLPNSYTSLQRRSLIDHMYLTSPYLIPAADNQTANPSMSGHPIPSSPATKGYLMPVANNEAATHPISDQQIRQWHHLWQFSWSTWLYCKSAHCAKLSASKLFVESEHIGIAFGFQWTWNFTRWGTKVEPLKVP